MNDSTKRDMIGKIQQDPGLKGRDAVIICLNRDCPSMLEDAYLLSKEGALQQLDCDFYEGIDQADGAEVTHPENGEVLVEFHEGRANKKNKDGRPNGIRLSSEGAHFPCEVYYNSGSERVTVEGEWVSPGSYTSYSELDPDSEEARRALEAYIKSPEVEESFNEVRRTFAEKKRAQQEREHYRG